MSVAGRPRPKTAVDIRVGRRITAEREVAQMSAEDLATRLGVTPSMLHRIEKGRVQLTMTRAIAIASILKIDVARLCEGITLADGALEEAAS